jgi:hypothetical protein
MSSKKPPKGKSLAEVNPELAKQWHPIKNGELTPLDFTSGSHSKVWWKCSVGEDHVWEAIIKNRNKGNGCAICRGIKIVPSNNLANLEPELCKEWLYSKNKINPNSIGKSSRLKVWWICSVNSNHIWEATITNRVRGRGCPFCSGNKVGVETSLEARYPEIAKEWFYESNGKITPKEILPGSNKIVWWVCNSDKKHIWKASVNDRTKGTGCPHCAGKVISDKNRFSVNYPELLKEWDYSKNTIDPKTIIGGARKTVWWKCKKGKDHQWQQRIDHRVRGVGCPICSGRKVVESNCLATTHPEIAKEWDAVQNDKLSTKDVTIGSHKKVWWKCTVSKEHTWKAVLKSRITRGCPYCTLTPQSKQELNITFELLKIFTDINPKGFKTRVEGKLWSIDIYIPELKIGIEFDGSYWHKDKKALDKLKTVQLEDAGFNIIRIREEPLEKIFETDIISKQPYDGKEITDNLLKQIVSSYKLDKRTVTKIEKYLLKDELQNQKGLDKYIEQILTEKAEKKSKLDSYAGGKW